MVHTMWRIMNNSPVIITYCHNNILCHTLSGANCPRLLLLLMHASLDLAKRWRISPKIVAFHRITDTGQHQTNINANIIHMYIQIQTSKCFQIIIFDLVEIFRHCSRDINPLQMILDKSNDCKTVW